MKDIIKIKLYPADTKIYDLLIRYGEMKPTEISNKIGKSIQNVSRSLRKLRARKMVEYSRRDNMRETFYTAR